PPTTQAPPTATTPEAPPINAGEEASKLYKAMHGGLFGMGTDEKAIFSSLEGKTPAQVDEIRASYQEHYQRDLDADIKKELSGTELQRAESLLAGDQAAADRAALNKAMEGWGTDEQQIFDTLEKNDPATFSPEYKAELRAHLRKELSGDALIRAEALLDGDRAQAEAAEMHAALNSGFLGIGKDTNSVIAGITDKSASELQAMEQSYNRLYGAQGGDFRAEINKQLGGGERDLANALLDGEDQATIAAARLRKAMDGMGTDEKAIRGILDGAGSGVEEIKAAYQQQYGRSLEQDLSKELSGLDEEQARSLLGTGELSDAERLNYAMKSGFLGGGTDEAAIQEVLRGKSPEQIAQLKADYQARYGVDLETEFGREMSGRDKFEVDMAMRGSLDAIQDEEARLQEALNRANERRDFERDSGFGNAVLDVLSDDGERLDANTEKANQAYQAAMADGQIDADEREQIEKLTGFVNQDVEQYQETKDTVAETASTVAATGAAVVATVATGGAAGIAIAAAAGAAAGAATKVGVDYAIKGQSQTNEGVIGDAVTGAVDGATVAIGGGLGARAATAAAGRGAGVVGQAAVAGAVDGAIGGAAGGAVQPWTKDDAFVDPAATLGQSVVGGAIGAAGGAGAGVVMGAVAAKIGASKVGAAADDVAGKTDDVVADAASHVDDVAGRADDVVADAAAHADDVASRADDAAADAAAHADDAAGRADDLADDAAERIDDAALHAAPDANVAVARTNVARVSAIDPTEANQLVDSAKLIQQPNGQFQLTPAALKEMNLQPVTRIDADGATYNVSRVFDLGNGRQGAVAYIDTPDGVEAHILYRSNSQAGWRTSDAAMRGGSGGVRHYGKGYDESSMQLPIPVTSELMRQGSGPVMTLKAAAGMPDGSDPANVLFAGLTQDPLAPGGRWVGDHYMSEGYADAVSPEPAAFSSAGNQLATPNGLSVADPASVKLPPTEKLPDFGQPVETFTYQNPRYASVTGDGTLTGTVYMSKDGSVRYLFIEDAQGHVSLGGAELVDAPVTGFGVRNQYLDLEGMDAPLMEYSCQIPNEYGGTAGTYYQDNWNYVREQPIIQHYYQELGMEVPPPVQ
ncbi:MAG: annexin, partial [Deltaproteobacteria bacterium]|nr:annexin [Deltaproteobacteria bacterium]